MSALGPAISRIKLLIFVYYAHHLPGYTYNPCPKVELTIHGIFFNLHEANLYLFTVT